VTRPQRFALVSAPAPPNPVRTYIPVHIPQDVYGTELVRTGTYVKRDPIPVHIPQDVYGTELVRTGTYVKGGTPPRVTRAPPPNPVRTYIPVHIPLDVYSTELVLVRKEGRRHA
jgi:hypothetical protein